MSGTHQVNGAMQDGRFFTSYLPQCEQNALLSASTDIATTSSADYRKHLQENGLKLLENVTGSCGIKKQCGDNGVAVSTKPPKVMPPYTTDPELK